MTTATAPSSPRLSGAAMTPQEIDAFLGEQRLCRLSTRVAQRLWITPLWFVWHRRMMWLSIDPRRSRWRGLHDGPRRGPLAAVVVDSGDRPGQVRGVELHGRLRLAGARPDLHEVERRFTVRYGHPDPRRYVWAYLVPGEILSWRSGS